MYPIPFRSRLLILLSVLGIAAAQAQEDRPGASATDPPLADELSQLRAEVAKLQAVIDLGHSAGSSGASSSDQDHQHAEGSPASASPMKMGKDMAMKSME